MDQIAMLAAATTVLVVARGIVLSLLVPTSEPLGPVVGPLVDRLAARDPTLTTVEVHGFSHVEQVEKRESISPFF